MVILLVFFNPETLVSYIDFSGFQAAETFFNGAGQDGVVYCSVSMKINPKQI